MLKSVDHYWTRDEVAKDTAHIYIFGDNLADAKPDKRGKYFIPTSTQAVIRGLPNVIGISTKKDRFNRTTSFFYDNDADFRLFKQSVDEGIEKALQSKKPIKISAYGLGTGMAAARGVFSHGTGRFFDYLYKRLGELA